MKKILAFVLAAVMLVGLAACGASSTPAAAPAAAPAADTPAAAPAAAPAADAAPAASGLPYEGHTLYVANWQGYCFDAPYAKTEFEKRTGAKVEMVYIDSYDDLMTRLQTGDNKIIDVVNISQNYTQYYRDQDLIKAYTKEEVAAKIPSFAGLGDNYREVYPYNVLDNGDIFAFPWTFGATSLVYNPEKLSFVPEHWTDLNAPELKGHVGTNRDYGDGMILAALLSGQDPSDPDNVDLDKVAAALEEFRPQVLTFWNSYDQIMNPYKSGEFLAGTMWSGAYVQLRAEGYPIEYVHPTEGTIAYIDCCAVVKGTDEEDLALEWINFLESYEIQYTMATTEGSDYNPEDWGFMAYCPVNQEVLDNLTDEQKVTLYLNPEPTKLCMLNYLSPDMKDAWVDCWNDNALAGG
jgi:spermidine/putrescine-binding protein